MTRILISALLLLSGSLHAFHDMPAPQIGSITEYKLPKPFKKATVTASASYDKKEDITILNVLKIKIDSQKEINIPKKVMDLFEGPRLDTIRVYVRPEFEAFPNELPPSQRISFAITFKFLARASVHGSYFDLPHPTAAIAVKNGEIISIYSATENRDAPPTFKSYDIKTLKPIPERAPLKK